MVESITLKAVANDTDAFLPRTLWEWELRYDGKTYHATRPPERTPENALFAAKDQIARCVAATECQRAAERKAEREAKAKAEWRVPNVG